MPSKKLIGWIVLIVSVLAAIVLGILIVGVIVKAHFFELPAIYANILLIGFFVVSLLCIKLGVQLIKNN
jgi:hypothetical protein